MPESPDHHSEKIKAVLLIAHGSRRQEANQELVDLAQRLQGQLAYEIIEPSYLELAEPDIVAGGSACVAKGASSVLMVPYFLSAGMHIRRDLTEARDTLRQQFPDVEFHLGPPLGPHPLLDELVCRRISDLDASA
ncbi:MAG: sirohydrochlorin chelatase [Isosphaeraceae bacterium]